jgi:hypothetical protein
MTRTRAQDRGRVAAWWGRWGRELVTALAVGLSAWAVWTTQHTVGDLKREGAERRDQTCTILETKQRSDVEALRRTYAYLAGLRPRELADPLNRAVLANLPNVVREAQTDDAPPYCDEKDDQGRDIGLPEPDPVIPKRPPGLNRKP